jgi:hypothetical protein
MKYIIASEQAIKAQGWKPISGVTRDDRVVINENEVRYRYHDTTFDEACQLIDGIVVTCTTALDFVYGRKSYDTILKELENE